jgi:hypothetical protein
VPIREIRVSIPRWSLNQNPFRIFCGTTLKDQSMKKTSFVPLVLAGLFVLSAARSGATVIAENFSADPLQNGWQVFGDTNLFQWDSTDQNLAVTWDSTQPNSYFYHPLGTVLAIDDDFSLSFDLQLSNAVAYSYGSELAIGLLHFSDATNADFSRGGGNSPNLFEFDYFPDTGFGDSIDATLKDPQPGYAGFYFAYDNLPLNPGVIYHVTLAHAAGSPTITGEVLADGRPYTTLRNIFNISPGDFRLDTISISSYADDGYGDSIFAQGTVGNLVATIPPPPVQNLAGSFTDSAWQAQFTSRSNWLYTLQRTADFQTWTDVLPAAAGDGGHLSLPDPNPPLGNAFYRVKAERP